MPTTELRPQLSYVLAATSSSEVNNAISWFRFASVSSEVEIVLAAPAPVLSRVAGSVIPPRVRLASVLGRPDRKAVRVAGAKVTTGLVVMVIDCNEDIAVRAGDPFRATRPAGHTEDPASWVEAPDGGPVLLPRALAAPRPSDTAAS